MVRVDNNKCIRCGGCVSVCPFDALKLEECVKFDAEKCKKCGICIKFCPVGAISME